MLDQILFLLFLAALAVSFRGALPGERARELPNGVLVFAASPLLYGAWWILVAFVGMVAFRALVWCCRGHLSFIPVVIACGTVTGFVGLIGSVPAAIRLDQGGLQQRRWLMKKQRIAWGEIVEIPAMKQSREIVIIGASGDKITHDRTLPDRPRLLGELKRHCGPELPPDFPGEPVSEV